MASRKFRFVSPGVFLKEIDNSQISATPTGVGPVIIGRTRTGPSLRPYKVRSLEELERVFGKSLPGNQGDDPWRDGTGLLAEAYAPYAARAYLRAGQGLDSPVTMIRLAGIAGDDATAGGSGEPGWKATSAWGLFNIASGSQTGLGVDTVGLTGTLAAIFYSTATDFTASLYGTAYSEPVARTGATAMTGAAISYDHRGKLGIHLVSNTLGTALEKKVSVGTEKLRQDFNTNPVTTNAQISHTTISASLAHEYWLGETFEESSRQFEAQAHKKAFDKYAVVLKLDTTMADRQSSEHAATCGKTGWVFRQDTGETTNDYQPENQEKLFRIAALHEGLDASRNLIISIEDIHIPRDKSLSKYGSFSVVVSRIMASSLEEIERFDDCNLNPTSQNFLAKKIGDQYTEWSSSEKRNRLYGAHPNISEFIRVDMDENVAQYGPTVTHHVPFGFYGPVVPADVTFSVDVNGTGSVPSAWIGAQTINVGGLKDVTDAKFSWPSPPIVNSGSATDNYMFGISPYKLTYDSINPGSSTPSTTINPGLVDYLHRLPTLSGLTADQDSGVAASANTKHAFKFTLDDVVLVPIPSKEMTTMNSIGDIQRVYYQSGSRNAALHDSLNRIPVSPKADLTGFTSSAGSYTQHLACGTGSMSTLLDTVGGFRMALCGGFDGTDITEADPFNARVLSSTATTKNSYAFASVERAIQMTENPELIEHNLAVMPGISNESLTTKLVRACESRADSLAIIDLPDIYKPPAQTKADSFKKRIDGTTPKSSATALIDRQINSSYGCTYYPWVKIRDEEFVRDVWVPPSVVALGVMAHTEKRDEVWFAPAGFNRGGLNQGNAGLPVLQVSEQLLSRDRDTLYQANINPIASFVSEGIVIFGQKTLQSTQSALDRINVRRLLLYIKKEVSRISNSLLFEQNVQATWKRFLNKVVPELESVKVRFGLTDFKVILDSTTTTPDLVDRNIMYAKIFLKPARSIEFIAVDFVITNTGAAFAD